MTKARRSLRIWSVLALLALLASCTVGPKYVRPSSPTASNFKEPAPDTFKEMPGWKVGDPKDDAHRGKWWEIFNDTQLNELEDQINVNNQNIAQAEANFRSARAAVKTARSGLFPQVTAAPVVTGAQSSSNTSVGTPSGVSTSRPPAANIQIPFDATWEADVWGRVRRTIESSIETAQASAADLENTRLSMQTDLALDYFQLRGLDAQKQLLDTTVTAYIRALELTNNRYQQGVASQVDVAQAETQLEQTRAQATDTLVQRQTLEHAIATLIGKTPSSLTIPVPREPWSPSPPGVPGVLPSQLLERRPDIAANERRVASANAQIGVAKAAFYPDITLSASAGLQGTSLVNLFTWPSRFWSLGPTLSYTLLDFGKRQGTLEQAEAAYDASVAVYRQSVLQAFQDVEDNLATLRTLEQESRQQAEAVRWAERSLQLANNQYQGGITTYLQVITAQATALANERTAVQLLTQRMTASVSLVKAIGGGWDIAGLPTPQEIAPWKGVQKVAEKVPAATP